MAGEQAADVGVKKRSSWNKGIPTHHTEATKLKIAASLKGHPCYEDSERGKNISLANKGRFIGKNNPFYGKKHCPELLNKIRESQKRTNLTPARQEYFKTVGGGMRGKKHTDEWKENLRKRLLGKTYEEIYGVEKAAEMKLKRRNYKLGEIQRKKISETLRGHEGWFKGKKHREESIAKIKEARKRQIVPVVDTSIEVKIQNYLRELKVDFLTHQYIKDIEHSYQCDILIPSMDLIIECDGIHWHKYPIGKEIDHVRTSELLAKGFKVLRLWETEIKNISIEEFRRKIECLNTGGGK